MFFLIEYFYRQWYKIKFSREHNRKTGVVLNNSLEVR